MRKFRPLRLFFIRHGQTESFEDPPFNGWRDAPLTSYGRQQLDQVAGALRGIPFDAVYSSDLSRAVYGGRQVAETAGLPLTIDPKWREMSFGRWEGWTYRQIVAENKELIERIFAHSEVETAFPEGESPASFSRRIEAGLEDLKRKYDQGGRVALVAHGGVCKVLWGLILKLPAEVAWRSIRQDFAAVNVADIYPDGQAVTHLVNGYLGPEGYYQTGPGYERLSGQGIF